MKIRVFFLLVAVSLFFVQCSTEEHREEKAQTLIQKELFETLPDYESYEMINISVDTLKDVLMASKEAISLTKKYGDINNEVTDIENEIKELKSKISSAKGRGQKMFFSGNYHILELTSLVDRVNAMENELSQKQSVINVILSKSDSKNRRICLRLNL